MGVGGQHHAPAALPPGKTQYHWLGGPHDQSGQAQNISPHRNSNPDCPACSKSVYQLRYPGPLL